jgi:hypothetical protein
MSGDAESEAGGFSSAIQVSSHRVIPQPRICDRQTSALITGRARHGRHRPRDDTRSLNPRYGHQRSLRSSIRPQQHAQPADRSTATSDRRMHDIAWTQPNAGIRDRTRCTTSPFTQRTTMTSMRTLSRNLFLDGASSRRLATIALLTALTVSGLAQAGWSAGPNMTNARAGAGSVTLADGRVMMIGGNDATRSYNALYSADLYNPTTNAWTQSSYSIAPHYLPGVARLQDGRVLIAGGLSGAGIQTIAETYNPATNTWAIAASLNQSRYALTLTTLANGEVLAIGGATTSGTPQTTVERYNPATNTWTYAAPLAVARRDHTATLLANGKVLVSAGEGVGWVKVASAELYDPATNTWSPAGNLATARSYHTATALANGDVLIAGGMGNNGSVAAAERYQAATNTWTSAGALSVARDRHIAVRMPSGKVLIAAGWPATNTSAQLYDPATNSWSAAGNMLQGRYLLGGGLAGNGKAVIAGGNTSTNVRLASSELYTE